MSLNSGRLILRYKGGRESVFGLSRRQRGQPYSAHAPELKTYPWHLAEVVVDPENLYFDGRAGEFEQGFVIAEFPPSVFSGPTRKTDGYRLKSESRAVFFDRRRRPDEEDAEDAELMQSVRAEARRKARVRDRWWRGRALALALGTQERIGERSPIRMLTPDALRAILASVHAAGPASEAEYYADYPGRPSYRLIRRYPSRLLQASESPPALPSLPSERRYVGCWYVAASVFAERSSSENAAGRGGPGPSPVGHEELQLMIAALDQTDEPRNPFRECYLAFLRNPLLEYLAWHPLRVEDLLENPRRQSNPPGAWWEHGKVLSVRHEEGDGRQRTLATSLHLRFNEEDVDEFDNSALSVIREALERGEDQPFTERERVTFRLVLASECRFLRGLDIAWVQPATGDAPSASPMIPGALPVAQ